MNFLPVTVRARGHWDHADRHCGGVVAPRLRTDYVRRSAVSIDTATKEKIIAEYATKEGDTGSPDVQVALLTHRITELTEHLKTHTHDHHSRRGLLLMVGRRRRLLKYIQKKDINHYRQLIQRLGLRR